MKKILSAKKNERSLEVDVAELRHQDQWRKQAITWKPKYIYTYPLEFFIHFLNF